MPKFTIPTIDEVRTCTEKAFGVSPRLFQIEDTISQLEQNDTITISPTGSGKTMTFWMPLLFNGGGIKIVVTSLNILGDQNVNQLARLGIKGINLTGANSTDQVFKEIEQGLYRVIIVSPERILSDSRFDSLWASKRFCSRLFNISVDEAHCIADWGSEFRPKYAELGRLRWVIPSSVRFHAVSATMPAPTLRNIRDKLRMQKENTRIIHLSNNRPNIHLVVKEMKHSASSMKDLIALLKFTEGNPPPKFLVFTNKRLETEDAVKAEWRDIPEQFRDKIRWFHSGMSAEFREAEIEKLKAGEIWGMICTDAAGMGLDIPDIELVIQWRYVSSLCTLFQRLGRAARGPSTQGRAIYLVEPQYFDGHQKKTIGKRKRGTKPKNPAVRRKQVPTSTPSDTPNNVDADTAVESQSENDDDEDIEGAEADGGNHTANGTVPDCVPPRTSEHLPTSLPTPSSLPAEEYEAVAMDLFINSGSRGLCRRVVLNQYFGNMKQGVRIFHTQSTADLCCDRCFPDAVHFLPPSTTSLPTAGPRRKRKFKVKKYTMGPSDSQLAKALHEWRLEQMNRLGLGGDILFGPQLILSDDILDRLVRLGHLKRLPDVDALENQTDWRYSREYGQQVLALVHAAYPMSEALGPIMENGTRVVAALPKPKRPRAPRPPAQCAACGNLGHIASNQLCPSRQGQLPPAPQASHVPVEIPAPTAPSTSTAVRTCHACGVQGHISSSRICSKWLERQAARQAARQGKENIG
ncbi:P-loop containing nucleoside triphosphate hydrolase protein [Agrocybe pediades]|nr:P-loop containing nucleoside triphosphate hydrolase protein [Agrocybe pediades]